MPHTLTNTIDRTTALGGPVEGYYAGPRPPEPRHGRHPSKRRPSRRLTPLPEFLLNQRNPAHVARNPLRQPS